MQSLRTLFRTLLATDWKLWTPLLPATSCAKSQPTVIAGVCRSSRCISCLLSRWRIYGSGSAQGLITWYVINDYYGFARTNDGRNRSHTPPSSPTPTPSLQMVLLANGGTTSQKPPYPTTAPPTVTPACVAPNATMIPIAFSGHSRRPSVVIQITSGWVMQWTRRTVARVSSSVVGTPRRSVRWALVSQTRGARGNSTKAATRLHGSAQGCCRTAISYRTPRYTSRAMRTRRRMRMRIRFCLSRSRTTILTALWWSDYAWRSGYTPLLNTGEEHGEAIIWYVRNGSLC